MEKSEFKKGQEKKEAINPRKIIIFSAIIAVVLVGFFIKNWTKDDVPRTLYQVAIVLNGQQLSDPAEDMRSSLKAGDVLLIQRGEHRWSSIEKASYLMLKMELSEEEKQKLLKSNTRFLTDDEVNTRVPSSSDMTDEQRQELFDQYKNQPEVLRLRAYQINIEKVDRSAEGLEKIYNWKIVKEKPEVK